MSSPRITIVTPSFNQASYLEATMRSVLDQQYPNLEYIVVDGGSSDGSVEIIKRYADRLAWWVSEPDDGQYAAINKGFARSSGEVMAWLNSDDIYFPWTLATVAHLFDTFPRVEWISGCVCFTNQLGQVITTSMMNGGLSQELAARGCYSHDLGGYLAQEGMFWRRGLWERSGERLNVGLSLAADFELWTRYAKFASPVTVKCLMAAFRQHLIGQRSIVMKDEYRRQVELARRVLPRPPLMWRFFGRSKGTNLLYCLLFLRGSSETIQYDLDRGQWIHHHQGRGPLYRLSVMKRKI